MILRGKGDSQGDKRNLAGIKPVSKAQETTALFVYFGGTVLLKEKSRCSVTCPESWLTVLLERELVTLFLPPPRAASGPPAQGSSGRRALRQHCHSLEHWIPTNINALPQKQLQGKNRSYQVLQKYPSRRQSARLWPGPSAPDATLAI